LAPGPCDGCGGALWIHGGQRRARIPAPHLLPRQSFVRLPSRPASPRELLGSATHARAFAHAPHRTTNRTCASGRAPGEHQTVPRTRLWSAPGWAPEGRLLTTPSSGDQSREGTGGPKDPRLRDPGCPGSGSKVAHVDLGEAQRTERPVEVVSARCRVAADVRVPVGSPRGPTTPQLPWPAPPSPTAPRNRDGGRSRAADHRDPSEAMTMRKRAEVTR
jgi:hypothetical protein